MRLANHESVPAPKHLEIFTVCGTAHGTGTPGNAGEAPACCGGGVCRENWHWPASLLVGFQMQIRVRRAEMKMAVLVLFFLNKRARVRVRAASEPPTAVSNSLFQPQITNGSLQLTNL